MVCCGRHWCSGLADLAALAARPSVSGVGGAGTRCRTESVSGSETDQAIRQQCTVTDLSLAREGMLRQPAASPQPPLYFFGADFLHLPVYLHRVLFASGGGNDM